MESFIILNFEGFDLAEQDYESYDTLLGDFVIKELAYVSSDLARGVVYVKPPKAWTDFTPAQRRRFVSTHLHLADTTHGFSWSEGHFPYEKLESFLVSLTSGYSKIYCPVFWKALILQKIINRDVEVKETWADADLDQDSLSLCTPPSPCLKHLGANNYCALQTAIVYYRYIREYAADHLTKSSQLDQQPEGNPWIVDKVLEKVNSNNNEVDKKEECCNSVPVCIQDEDPYKKPPATPYLDEIINWSTCSTLPLHVTKKRKHGKEPSKTKIIKLYHQSEEEFLGEEEKSLPKKDDDLFKQPFPVPKVPAETVTSSSVFIQPSDSIIMTPLNNFNGSIIWQTEPRTWSEKDPVEHSFTVPTCNTDVLNTTQPPLLSLESFSTQETLKTESSLSVTNNCDNFQPFNESTSDHDDSLDFLFDLLNQSSVNTDSHSFSLPSNDSIQFMETSQTVAEESFMDSKKEKVLWDEFMSFASSLYD